MNAAPNASQKRWREYVRENGSCVSGGNAVIHHPVGRTAKHNKVHVGHWWVLPLTDDEHRALHLDFDSFVQDVYFWNGETRKEVEKKLFAEMVENIGMHELPQEAYDAIQDYRR